MVTTRRITFKLNPNRQQEKTLHYWRKLHCALYNATLYNRKTQYQKFGHSVNYLEQQNCLPDFKEVWTEYKPLGSHALQATLKRVDFAFSRFFKGLGGYPKFKASRRYGGWTYPCKSGWKAETDGKNGHLNITNLGKIQMRGQARTWGVPTTCTIMFRNGAWFVSITVQCSPVRNTGVDSVGIDLGCKDAITLSTGEKIAKPDFIKKGQRQIKAASKNLRRKRAPNRNKRVKASRRWNRERQKVSQLQRKVARQREDWLHKTTSNIVSGNSLVAGEKLNVKGMTRKAKKGKRKAQKSGLNRSILDVGFGMIGQMLEYKLSEAGGFYVESPTQTLKPTQRCAKCWELTPKTLADRVHVCSNPNCNNVEDRDVNAAQVNLIWARGLERASLVAESPSSTSCGSMRQLGAKKRQKQLSAAEGVGNSDLSVSRSE
ncbi:transposase [Microcoleus sp. FACHB-SPT15]|uniref:RNA-guided endonuclease InsQ/TnpB family protein n=1 Tax=Microcoleus sp. FACHB-SPT15 TaxID=2692830 RepID=UPI0017863215|nr:RNA-guided endonuclease TnpB family protein [Microcoleus sp. FACHB-SPT15]MBD1805412.1 transposase [Microcoleus sp. FACHB-SPT15]